MTKLNAIVALEKGVKTRTYNEITELNKAVQKPDKFSGFLKRYNPRDEEDQRLPQEMKIVEYNAFDMLDAAEKRWEELMNVVYLKDATNCDARADIVVDDKVLLPRVPVTYLLFLEKQLDDVRKFVANLPVLDASERWSYDENHRIYESETTSTHRTKKIQKPIVLYQATKEHPAQTAIVSEDVMAGTWDTIKFSGAIPKPKREKMLEKVDKLIKAVKTAREEANSIDLPVKKVHVAEEIFSFLLDT